jgi:hypothetical protein
MPLGSPQACVTRNFESFTPGPQRESHELVIKCRAPGTGQPFCASLRKSKFTLTSAVSCQNLPTKYGAQDRDAQFARACAVKMHMVTSQEPFYAIFYLRENCQAPRTGRTVVTTQWQFHARICSKNAKAQKLGVRFLRACAVEIHLDISQEQFDVRI